MTRFRMLALAAALALAGACAHFPIGPGNLSHVKRVGWTRAVRAQLDSLWRWSVEEDRELAYCLYGNTNIGGTAVFVRRTEPPVREEFPGPNALAVACRREEFFLGVVHTHLSRYAGLSDADRASLAPSRFELMAVLCGPACRRTWTAWHDYPLETVGP